MNSVPTYYMLLVVLATVVAKGKGGLGQEHELVNDEKTESPELHTVYEIINITNLPQELAEKAEADLHETAQTKEVGLATLKQLLQGEQNLTPCLDDHFLLSCLRGTKFNVKEAHTETVNFYKIKHDNQPLFSRATPQSVQSIIRARMITVLPYRNHDGCAVILFTTSKWCPEQHSLDDFMAAAAAVAAWIVLDTETQISGVKLIWDFEGFTMRQFLKFHPHHLALASTLAKAKSPIRVTKIVVLHQGHSFDLIYNALSLLLSDKITSRVVLLGKHTDRLGDHIDPYILPEKYGGKTKQCSNEEFLTQFLKSQPIFDYAEQFGYLQDKPKDSKLVADNGTTNLETLIAKLQN